MNTTIEESFITTFLVRYKQERARFALRKKDKRRAFFRNFKVDFLIQEKTVQLDKHEISCRNDLIELLRSKGAPEQCYCMTFDSPYDGQEVSLIEAVEHLWGCGQLIISCIPGKLAYYEDEQEYGPPARYLLVSE